jgi:hypothetical protein
VFLPTDPEVPGSIPGEPDVQINQDLHKASHIFTHSHSGWSKLISVRDGNRILNPTAYIGEF